MPSSGVQTWPEVITQSFQDLWVGFLNVTPRILSSLVILVIGWIVALALEQLVARLLKALKVNESLDRSGVMEAFKRAEVKIDPVAIIAALVRWFVFFAFLVAVVDVLGLQEFNAFLRQVLLYVPNIILAALILLVSAVGSDFLERLVSGAVRAAGLGYASLVGAIARWSVFIFGVIAALEELGVATTLLQTLVTGFVAMIAIAGGLAFGLGGKDLAASFLEHVRRRLS